MKDIEEFFTKFVAELKLSPPKLVGGELTDAKMGDWLVARFTLEELEIFRKFEDTRGPHDANLLVSLAFLTAGLESPIRAK